LALTKRIAIMLDRTTEQNGIGPNGASILAMEVI